MSRGIEIIDLTMEYGDIIALDHVSLKVRNGEMLAVLGPSGCGKSTMLSLISGLQTPTRGQIYIDDQRIDHLPAQQRGIGFLFQNYALFPHMTVRENIGYGLKIKRMPRTHIKQRVDELLKTIGLFEHVDKKPHQLSGGQQQRVALARALAPKPDIILLDEPLSALDVKIRQKLRSELKQIQKELGITTILVTHDQEEAFQLGDRVAVMNHGRIEQIGTPAEIYENPASEFVACFVGEINVLTGFVKAGQVHAGNLVLELPESLKALPSYTPLKILIRPENFKLVKAERQENAAGTASGILCGTTFLGSQLKLEVLIDNDQIIQVTMPKDQATHHKLSTGDQVTVFTLANQVVPA